MTTDEWVNYFSQPGASTKLLAEWLRSHITLLELEENNAVLVTIAKVIVAVRNSNSK